MITMRRAGAASDILGSSGFGWSLEVLCVYAIEVRTVEKSMRPCGPGKRASNREATRGYLKQLIARALAQTLVPASQAVACKCGVVVAVQSAKRRLQRIPGPTRSERFECCRFMALFQSQSTGHKTTHCLACHSSMAFLPVLRSPTFMLRAWPVGASERTVTRCHSLPWLS